MTYMYCAMDERDSLSQCIYIYREWMDWPFMYDIFQDVFFGCLIKYMI